MTSKKKGKENFLDYIPVKNIGWDKDDKGKVYLIKEKTKNKWMKRIIDWVHKNQFFHIHLDETGSATWLAIDGQRTVREIVEELKREKGEAFTQAEERVSYFVGMLKKSDFVRLGVEIKEETEKE